MACVAHHRKQLIHHFLFFNLHFSWILACLLLFLLMILFVLIYLVGKLNWSYCFWFVQSFLHFLSCKWQMHILKSRILNFAWWDWDWECKTLFEWIDPSLVLLYNRVRSFSFPGSTQDERVQIITHVHPRNPPHTEVDPGKLNERTHRIRSWR